MDSAGHNYTHKHTYTHIHVYNTNREKEVMMLRGSEGNRRAVEVGPVGWELCDYNTHVGNSKTKTKC